MMPGAGPSALDEEGFCLVLVEHGYSEGSLVELEFFTALRRRLAGRSFTIERGSYASVIVAAPPSAGETAAAVVAMAAERGWPVRRSVSADYAAPAPSRLARATTARAARSGGKPWPTWWY